MEAPTGEKAQEAKTWLEGALRGAVHGILGPEYVGVPGEKSDCAEAEILDSWGGEQIPFDYVWYWTEKARPVLGDRKGQRCRVLARGALNSIAVEFESDRHKVITSRYAVRKQN